MQLTKFGDLWRQGWELYQKRWKSLVALMAIPFVIGVAYNMTIVKTVTFVGTGVHTAKHVKTEVPPLGILLGLLLVVVSLMVQVAIVRALDGDNDNPDVMELLKKSKSLILPLLLVGILAALAVVGGLILLIVPGIIFMVWFAFSTYTLILEDKHGVEALKASKALVVGRWWDVFGRFILLLLSLAGIAIVAEIVASIFPKLLHLTLAGAVSNFVVAPLAAAFSYKLYKDLKHHRAQSTES